MFNPSELSTFYDAVEEYLESQGHTLEIKNGYAILQSGKAKIDLRNIAQDCRQTEEGHWRVIIENYFRQIESIRENAFSVGDKPFAEVADLLAVRLWPNGTLQNVGAGNLIYREDLEGTISTLVLNLPDSIQAVTPQMATSWEKSKDELFNIGFDNVFAHCKPDIAETVLAGDIKTVTLSNNNDFLTATHVFFIEKYPNCIGKYGSLVGIPLRDIVVCYPINDNQIARAIQVLVPTIKDVYVEGPGSVSPYVYWYHEDCFEAVHYVEKKNEFVLPNQLLDILKSSMETKN